MRIESRNLRAWQSPPIPDFLFDTRKFLALYQPMYVDEAAVAALTALRQRVSTRKRYADVVIVAIAMAQNAIVLTRNVEDFRDLLPAAKIQNWVDQVY
jgi:predicted nucleic acid-binding protein